MTDKPKKPPVRDISELKAKLGLKKSAAKKGAAPGVAVPPPAGVVPPPAGVPGAPVPGAPVPGPAPGAGPAGAPVPGPAQVVPTPVAPAPGPSATAAPAAPAGEPVDLDVESLHGKKQVITYAVFGVLAVIGFFAGCQCGRMVLFRGWRNKVTRDSKKLTEEIKKMNKTIRQFQALEAQYPLVDKRGNPVIEYSAEFGQRAERLLTEMGDLKEAQVLGTYYYNMLKKEDMPAVVQLFRYLALMKRLKILVVSLRRFESQTEFLKYMTKEGRKKLEEKAGKIQFGAYFVSPGSVAIAVLDPKNAVCGKKLDKPCGNRQPDGYKIGDRAFGFSAGKQEEKLLRVSVQGNPNLGQCLVADAPTRQAMAAAKAAFQMYRIYRMEIHQVLKEIEAKVKPNELYKTYSKYANRGMVRPYFIF